MQRILKKNYYSNYNYCTYAAIYSNNYGDVPLYEQRPYTHIFREWDVLGLWIFPWSFL